MLVVDKILLATFSLEMACMDAVGSVLLSVAAVSAGAGAAAACVGVTGVAAKAGAAGASPAGVAGCGVSAAGVALLLAAACFPLVLLNHDMMDDADVDGVSAATVAASELLPAVVVPGVESDEGGAGMLWLLPLLLVVNHLLPQYLLPLVLVCIAGGVAIAGASDCDFCAAAAVGVCCVLWLAEGMEEEDIECVGVFAVLLPVGDGSAPLLLPVLSSSLYSSSKSWMGMLCTADGRHKVLLGLVETFIACCS